MKIIKGTTRIVFVFHHIVIKLPVIEIKRSFKQIYLSTTRFFKSVKKNGLKKHYLQQKKTKQNFLQEEQEYIIKTSKTLFLELVPCKQYEILSLPYLLFGGIMANWNEYVFYKQTKNVFVMPTYFSLFGLVNIQKRGYEIVFWQEKDVWMYICDNSLNQQQPFCHSHSFNQVENFCLDNGNMTVTFPRIKFYFIVG
jgi:hypothetical protein